MKLRSVSCNLCKNNRFITSKTHSFSVDIFPWKNLVYLLFIISSLKEIQWETVEQAMPLLAQIYFVQLKKDGGGD